MEKFILLAGIIIFQFGSFCLRAQDAVTKTPIYKHSIGAAAGFTIGYGLSYRYTPTKLGVQVVFGPYADGEITQLSNGLTFLYYIFKERDVNFFLYQGNHYLYRHAKEYYYGNNPHIYYPEPEIRWVTQNRVNNGLGFGFDFNIGNRISWNIMSGYGAYNNFSKFTLIGETALYFKL